MTKKIRVSGAKGSLSTLGVELFWTQRPITGPVCVGAEFLGGVDTGGRDTDVYYDELQQDSAADFNHTIDVARAARDCAQRQFANAPLNRRWFTINVSTTLMAKPGFAWAYLENMPDTEFRPHLEIRELRPGIEISSQDWQNIYMNATLLRGNGVGVFADDMDVQHTESDPRWQCLGPILTGIKFSNAADFKAANTVRDLPTPTQRMLNTVKNDGQIVIIERPQDVKDVLRLSNVFKGTDLNIWVQGRKLGFDPDTGSFDRRLNPRRDQQGPEHRVDYLALA